MNTSFMKRTVAAVAAVGALSAGMGAAQAEDVKAGFVYVRLVTMVGHTVTISAVRRLKPNSAMPLRPAMSKVCQKGPMLNV